MPLWTPPRTWITGEIVTDAELNANIRDNLLFLRAAHACRVWSSVATQSVPDDGAFHPFAWDSEVFDSDGFHDPAVNPTRITIPTGLDGYYVILGTGVFPGTNAVGRRDIRILLNGTTILNTGRELNPNSVNNARPQTSTAYRLIAADYIELAGFQNSGAGANLAGGTVDDTQLSLVYEGL